MKKRIIPRSHSEFEYMIKPLYENQEYHKVISRLLSFWRQKGKSDRSLYFANYGLISSSFHGEINIDPNLIARNWGIPIDGIVYDKRSDFYPFFDDEFYHKHQTSYDFLHYFFRNIKWNGSLEVIYAYYDKKYYIRKADVGLTYNKSFIYGIENNRLDILVGSAIEYEIKKISFEASKHFRKSLGLDPISKKWKKEYELFEQLSLKYSNEVVLPQGSPKWLKGQRFDVWLPEHNLAIEYNGIQHFEPIDFFGGEEGLKATQQRDHEKRLKCREHNCEILEVKEDYSFEGVCNWIDSKIK